MLNIGQMNMLTATRLTANGIYLRDDAGENSQSVLLPHKHRPEGLITGGQIRVFVYKDSEDRLVATTQQPLLQIGQYAFLRCQDTTPIGAFFDWGLDKDLLVPFRQQSRLIKPGEKHVVHLYQDVLTQRLVGTTRISRTLSTTGIQLAEGEPVNILPYHTSELGVNVIVENRYSGLVFHNETHRELNLGQTTQGYIKAIRSDGKLDISLRPPGRAATLSTAEIILKTLEAADGRLALSDKSSPEEIQAKFGVSKKVFKQALGSLYKDRRITITDQGITLTS